MICCQTMFWTQAKDRPWKIAIRKVIILFFYLWLCHDVGLWQQNQQTYERMAFPEFLIWYTSKSPQHLRYLPLMQHVIVLLPCLFQMPVTSKTRVHVRFDWRGCPAKVAKGFCWCGHCSTRPSTSFGCKRQQQWPFGILFQLLSLGHGLWLVCLLHFIIERWFLVWPFMGS